MPDTSKTDEQYVGEILAAISRLGSGQAVPQLRDIVRRIRGSTVHVLDQYVVTMNAATTQAELEALARHGHTGRVTIHTGPQHTSILRPWVEVLPRRYQGVLLAAIRGCDGQPKENSAKPIVRCIRYAVLFPADPREVGMASAFMAIDVTDQCIRDFLRNWDHYPIHFVQHLMHAAQVIGAAHPDEGTRESFTAVYLGMVHKLHLEPESVDTMHARLTEDRIAKYGNAVGDVG